MAARTTFTCEQRDEVERFCSFVIPANSEVCGVYVHLATTLHRVMTSMVVSFATWLYNCSDKSSGISLYIAFLALFIVYISFAEE